MSSNRDSSHQRNAGSQRKRIVYRDRVVQQDDGEGNWLVSYADMMTLLFGFFVILSAFSTPSASKLEKLKESTAKAMKVKYESPNESLAHVFEDILKSSHLESEVKVVKTDSGITIIMKGTLFFESGSTTMRPEAKALIDKIGGILVKGAKTLKVIVEGHTDDVPIVSSMFPSNWELSSARASTVVRELETAGYPHDNLLPMGLADTDPLVPNLNPDGTPNLINRSENRRIVVRVVNQLPERTGHLKGTSAMDVGK